MDHIDHIAGYGRRDFLRAWVLGTLGVSAPALLAAQYPEERRTARAKACILLFLAGGPSHFETFDPKPDAPAENRTIFDTIRTSVPGTQLCEYLPKLAAQAHRYALIRSAWHRCTGHFGGHRYALSGHIAVGNIDQQARPDDPPGVIALAAKSLRQPGQTLPPSVMTPWVATDQGGGASGGMGAGTLGRAFDPVRVEVDPRSVERSGTLPVFRIPEFALHPSLSAVQLRDRRQLLDVIDTSNRTPQREMSSMYDHAFELLTSDRVRQAFELEREPARLRDEYGQNAFGQSCLLARRLVERGTRFVQVNFARSVTQRGYGWDTHGDGAATLKDQLLPKLDMGAGTLLEDLAQRGLLDGTLVVAMGEFGRTPQVKRDGGRDHWPQCYSLLMAGGGIHGGLVHGRSDRIGARPAHDPVEAREILVTILELLGIPNFQVDPQGRGAPLFPGVEAVRRLFA